jgi:AraC-like DNA-binding protein
MEGDEPTRFFRHITITPKLRAPLRQIAANPYQGLVRLFFWESKVLELLAYTLEQFGETAGPSGGREELGRRDRDRAHQARELLCSDLQYPPSLADLAKAVGTSHAKLNRIFRRAFGCTVFAFIREQRLDWAAALLADERLSITDVAFATGFCSSSHFAACFLKRFGMQPSRYRSMAIG